MANRHNDTTRWRSLYKAEFLRYATERGWDTETAARWKSDCERDAWIFCNQDNPAAQARIDVLECENGPKD